MASLIKPCLIRRACLAFSLAMLISACGWQLRGMQSTGSTAGQIPQTLGLQVMTHNSKMAQEIQKILRGKEVVISNDAPLTLVLNNENLDKRPLSVTDTGVTAQYQLTLTVHYHFQKQTGSDADRSNQETEQLAPRTVTSWRNYDFDAKLIVAKTQEEQSLLKEMREELAHRILSDLPQ